MTGKIDSDTYIVALEEVCLSLNRRNKALEARVAVLTEALRKNAQTHHDNAETPHQGTPFFHRCERYACINARVALTPIESEVKR